MKTIIIIITIIMGCSFSMNADKLINPTLKNLNEIKVAQRVDIKLFKYPYHVDEQGNNAWQEIDMSPSRKQEYIRALLKAKPYAYEDDGIDIACLQYLILTYDGQKKKIDVGGQFFFWVEDYGGNGDLKYAFNADELAHLIKYDVHRQENSRPASLKGSQIESASSNLRKDPVKSNSSSVKK